MKSLTDKLLRDRALTGDEFSALIGAAMSGDKELLNYTMGLSVAERDRIFGREVYLRGLCEISNHCKNNCYYCGIRCDKKTDRYRLDAHTILNALRRGYNIGFRSFVLQGGEDGYYTDDMLARLICDIKRELPGCALTLSLGERSKRSYARLRRSGADRYLLRHETADNAHYRTLHPEQLSPAHRKECLFTLRHLGFQVGAGMMIGSPGQTAATLAQDMLFLRELSPHMCGIGPFLPAAGTPFEKSPPGSLALTLFMLALTRIMLPFTMLPSTTALATLGGNGHIPGLDAGANVIMPNLTPSECVSDYELYDNKAYTGLQSAANLEDIRQRLASAGYTAHLGRGDSPLLGMEDIDEPV